MAVKAFQNDATTAGINGTPIGAGDQPVDYIQVPTENIVENEDGTTTTTTTFSSMVDTGSALQAAPARTTTTTAKPKAKTSAMVLPSATSGTGSAGAANLSKGESVASLARKFLGVPYKWGGTGPLGFDCSGLMQYVYKNALGITLPRVSYQQATSGTAVKKADKAVGDLIWFDNSSRNNGADHIGMYIGNGQILEAPRAGVPVRIRTLKDSENYGVTRVIKAAATMPISRNGQTA